MIHNHSSFIADDTHLQHVMLCRSAEILDEMVANAPTREEATELFGVLLEAHETGHSLVLQDLVYTKLKG